MKRLLSKLISLVLAMAMIIQILPQKVFADVGTVLSPEQTEGSVSESSYSPSPTYVEGEVIDLRSEDGKHFKLSDGSFLSVSYGNAVHYQDTEGIWQDIDNSLTLNRDGSYYATKENGNGSFFLAKDLSSGNLVEAHYNNHTVSMDLMGAYNKNAILEVKEKETGKTASDKVGWYIEDLVPQRIDTKVTYRNVYPGIDIEYTLHSFNLKESIVLNEKQNDCRFDFLLTLKGLTTSVQEDGSIMLCDEKGSFVYYIPTPFMEDAIGSISYDVWYELVETEKSIVVTITCDPDWLDSPERVYPVRIDPSLELKAKNNSISNANSNIYTTYTLSARADESIASAGLPQHLFVGYDPASGHTRGYVYFNNMPSIPSGAEVIGAYYGIHLFNPYWDGYYGYYGNRSELPLEIREVTSGKPSGYSSYFNWFMNMTWNSQSNMTYGTVLDFRITNSGSTGEWIDWDITGSVKKWYKEGTENRTICIIPSDESAHNNSSYAWIRALSYGDTYPPTLIVAYRNTDGIEPYYTYNTLDTGHAGTAYIADRTGQLKVAKSLVSYYSTVNPVSIGLVYNSDYFQDQSQDYLPYGPSMDFGSGWTLDIVQRLESETIDDTDYLKYTDGDGTQHFFAKKSGDNTYFYDEDGLGLKIRSVSGNYEMTDDKNNKRIFTGGYLKQIIDHNGNEISIAYTNGKVTSVTQTNNGTSVTGITVASFTYTGDRLTSIQDAAGITTTLTYDNGKLVGITKGNTQIAEYGYTGQRISKLTDKEALYSLNFTYDTNGKVSSYHESAWDDTLSVPAERTGAWVSVSYPEYSQTVYMDYGPDRSNDGEGTLDNVFTSYLFDNAGRTVNAYSTDASGDLLGATNAVYTENDSTDRRNNRTRQISSMGESGTELLENNGFEDSTDWTLPTGSSRTAEESHSGDYSVKIEGVWNSASRNANQCIVFDSEHLPSGEQTYILSGWAKGISVPNTNYGRESDHDTDIFKQFGLRAVIKYSDNTEESHYVPFCPDLNVWQFTSAAIVPKEPTKTVTSITVYAVYEKNANAAYFDDISLIKEVCKTMKYDEDGNLVSVLTTGLEEVTSTYSNGNLIEMVTGGYGSYELHYDNNHNLTSVSDDNVTQTMTYSVQGNVTDTALTDASETLQIETNAGYDANGNRVTAETDDAGNIVRYGYSSGVSEMLGLPSSITDGELNVTTYQYDTLGRTENIVADGIVSVGFGYTRGCLSSISRVLLDSQNTPDNTSLQVYHFTYDAFGNPKSLGVGNKTLVSYDYADGNGNLESETYGNGYCVEFEYDDRGRMEAWEDSTHTIRREYQYDHNNRPYTIEDSNGRKYTYEYDNLDRIIEYEMEQGSTNILFVTNSYTDTGQPSTLEWTIGGSIFTSNHIYGGGLVTAVSEGKLYSMATGVDNNNPLIFDYDDFGRLDSISGKTTREYSYMAGAGNNTTTTLVSEYTNKHGLDNFYHSTFTYDGNGNIETENYTDSLNSAPALKTFTYNELGELIRCVDGNNTYEYTYDGAGNILSASLNDDPVYYEYGDDDLEWKDLLVKFNGETISYDDNDGNPTSYFNGKRWDFEWDRGRLLGRGVNRIENDEVDLSFNYDLDGIRIEKQVTYRTYHNYQTTSVNAPTCTQQGYTVKTCSCGSTINTDYVPALGHDYIESYVSPTCTQQGYTLHTCSRCGDTYMTDYISYLGHNYVVSYISPTCTQQGYTLHTCSVCGYSYESDYIAANGHDYYTDGFVIAPTCTQQGYTLYICSVCGDELEGDIVPALGHNWVYNSMRHYWRCSRCFAITYGLDDQSLPDDPDSIGENEEGTSEEIPMIDEVELIEDVGDETYEDQAIASNVSERQNDDDEEIPLRDIPSDVESEVIVTYSYIYIGDKLVQESVTKNQATEIHNFFYDNNGTPYAMKIGDEVYYYITNLQGDVIGVIDSAWEYVARYSYDPYGKVSIEYEDEGFVGKNPLLYRGYYYDYESGLYYLLSRYYDPNICRFINADSQISTDKSVIGLNLFSYCGNDPINRSDPLGTDWWHWALGAAIVVTCAVATVITCGGVAAAATAVYMVCNGAAAATTAATIAAGAFVGSATAFGLLVITADMNSSNIQEFYDQGDWGTVFATMVGGMIGGYEGNAIINSQPFLPDEFYSQHAPKQSTPYSTYEKYTYNQHTGQYEKSTAYYDTAGRQVIRIDWTNHGRQDHGNPHVHITFYDLLHRDGITTRWD